MPTYILSYPGRGPRAALQEWLTFADRLTLAGARILVFEPTDDPAAAPLLLHAAHLGTYFPQPQSREPAVFLLSPEAAALAPAFAPVGLRTQAATQDFHGQADLIPLPRGRFLLTHAEGTEPDPALRGLLPPGAKVLSVPLRAPLRRGHQALAALLTTSNDAVLLVHTAGLAAHGLADLARFAGDGVDTVPIEAPDAAAGVTSALSVRGALFMNPGASSTLRGRLVRRGFQLEELALPHLLALGPGHGPRSLVNELGGFVLADDAPSYGLRREALRQHCEQLPES